MLRIILGLVTSFAISSGQAAEVKCPKGQQLFSWGGNEMHHECIAEGQLRAITEEEYNKIKDRMFSGPECGGASACYRTDDGELKTVLVIKMKPSPGLQ
mgnify:CR=1 FL=1